MKRNEGGSFALTIMAALLCIIGFVYGIDSKPSETRGTSHEEFRR